MWHVYFVLVNQSKFILSVYFVLGGDKKRLGMCTFCSSVIEIAINPCNFVLRLQRE